MAVRKTLEFFAAYVKVNMQAAMEYRMNFIVQAGGMIINDMAWLIFWLIFFAKFPVVNGWGFNDVVMMYSIITMAFGMTTFFFGNFRYMADIIIKGSLDYYLALPKSPLLHMLISRSNLSGAGDFLFGLAIFFFVVPINPQAIFLFSVLIAMSFIMLLHFSVIIGSLTFFIGGTGKTQDTLLFSIVTFSSYPFSSFEGVLKILLLTIIPVGFISGIPVEIMKNFSPLLLMYMFIATVAIVAAAHIIFRIGLKRYESGNLINARI